MEDPTGPQSESLQEKGIVGYGRPPLASRWKAGQSGNPPGAAPKGYRDLGATIGRLRDRDKGRLQQSSPSWSQEAGGIPVLRSVTTRGGLQKKSVASLVEAALPPETETKVGYRQPPLHSRWKSGQTGNPIGKRPRDILQEVLLSPFPVKIGAKVEMAPAIDVMLLRVRARALEGDQGVIRSLIEHFGSNKFARKLVSGSKK